MSAVDPVGRPTVREATFQVLRDRGLTTMFANPGSTEVPFLTDLPDDIDFVLALHEGSVVGIATGHALATGRAALVLLHTTAGLGNAVGAIATARVNRAALVVVVGQQDRRHLALEPFLTGRLARLAGDYPVAVLEPSVAGDVPSAVARACSLAEIGRGPVIVIVPMDDWDAPAAPDHRAAPDRLAAAPRGAPPACGEVAELLVAAHRPALVAGAGVDTPEGWSAVEALTTSHGVRVYAEPFGARAGFDQGHPLYAGQLPADRTRLREVLGRHDLVLVVGTAALRQYPFDEGPLAPETTTLVVLTSEATEAARSPVVLSLLGDEVAMLQAVAALAPARPAATGEPDAARSDVAAPGAGGPGTLQPGPMPDMPAAEGPLRPSDVFAVLAAHLPRETVLVEESPSSRPLLQAIVPARRPMGFLSAAMGGLGFALPAAIGIRMARPDWPVLAVVGDGSSLYSVQALWTAAHRQVGVVFLVMANGRYAVMDRLADRRGGKAPWPAFPELSVATIARGMGVPAQHVGNAATLHRVLPDICRNLATRREPLVLEMVVDPDTTFHP